jgi:hypothetical protein
MKKICCENDILFTVYFSLLIQEILNYRTLNINLYIESKLQMPFYINYFESIYITSVY